MKRDWQKDMELLQKPHKDIADVVTILDGIAPYWHQEAKRWRFEAFRKYPTPDAYDTTCKALHKHRERADAAVAREQKLREAIEEVLRDATKWENPYEGYNDLLKLLDSLYSKEETKP
ncbi:hypothetical protein [Paenibacillus lautus]|uniref:hypothetical protein n=1 Tax=Paenibacillus lautus TaxID=1401 RepID=UPI001C7E1A4E|nr:hypothetical protein [Paenibacillus lautus]MBX4152447.1 hypothetical protein [Paenibacillus lautus]